MPVFIECTQLKVAGLLIRGRYVIKRQFLERRERVDSIHSNRQADRHRHRKTDRQTNKQTEIQAGRQIQTEAESDKEKETENMKQKYPAYFALFCGTLTCLFCP